MPKVHLMVRFVQVVTVLFVLLGCFVIFLYSPFYSKLIVAGLNYFVPVDVNEVAAESQRKAALSEHDNLEPGSNLWIARQAYLKLTEDALRENKTADLGYIQENYKALQQIILLEEKEQELQEEKETTAVSVPLVAKNSEIDAADEASSPIDAALSINSSENKALTEQYTEFLARKPVVPEHQKAASEPEQKVEYVRKNPLPAQPKKLSEPYAIVVLGGGLTLDKNGKDIVVNSYTRLRLEKTLEVEKKNHLPIVLSGVEAPYMQAWLKARGVDAKLLEKRSMNTCENTRFSSLLLQKKGGAPTVMLVTDEYHMPRTRRLFALNGIETIPVTAPIPTPLTRWQPSIQNYDHSRRANYELLATIRDMLFGSSDCREVP
ncbi:TPA: YdcF family protein [Acinetobacter baumannii]|uniref:YdcF family protein n=1 Tax=Acinetobacter baumannii TaxID=470 RepID=UPI00165F2559|nr:YdcF family protein [Acinetobacter baumannii]EKU5224250.1 YdcF family protein [Acinetobacter baumannii]EKU6960384.1 YdcF family protein [Acinetobacter baumannii]EKV1069026.1 YdcF family protein [Acinetobacter baumannii]EKV1111054.1 YdcF family protein [Acinetobacter baumannii]EKV1145689.1 YdcF family protein [Acinetobacter baumannii]